MSQDSVFFTPMQRDIRVTRARLPRREDFLARVEAILAAGQFANNGPQVRELERALELRLSLPHVLACASGTSALMLAAHCAGLRGKKVALPPYTYVATLSALLWLGCEPVFVDVDPATLCLSPDALREAFQRHPDIAGVMPVHVYGFSCDVEAIGSLCREHGVPLIYDAAQAFGSRLDGRSLLDYGDLSVCSFHATKVFHSGEGGCVVSHDDRMHADLSLARAFGHVGDTHLVPGVNAKMGELHAALGLAMLPDTDVEIMRREWLVALYDDALHDVRPRSVSRPEPPAGLRWNHAYYPVLLPDEAALLRVMGAMEAEGIHPRRYFYPSLTDLPYVHPSWRGTCPVAEDAARRVLCLPLHGALEEEIVHMTSGILARNLH